MQTIRYELIPAQGTEGQVAVITFDEANSPVNTMCRQWQQELGEVTAQVLGDRERLGAALKGIVLASAKTSFFAGADLSRPPCASHPPMPPTRLAKSSA